jgi:hypothetical protein
MKAGLFPAWRVFRSSVFREQVKQDVVKMKKPVIA